MSGISAGKFIHKTILANKEAKSIVGENVFPNIITKDVNYPFIVFEIAFSANKSKDGRSTDEAEASIRICSNSYDQTIDIGEIVRSTLDGVRSSEFGVLICKLEKGHNYPIEGIHIQELIFKLIVK